MDVRWHGHSFFSLVCKNGTKILIDPFIENGLTRLRMPDFSPDLILVTHGHDDHVGSAPEFGVPCIATFELAEHLEERGARGSIGMNVGGSHVAGGIRFWCTPAMHSSGLHGGKYGGVASGFVVDDGETRFYHAGDTGLFSDMRAVIHDLLKPHVAALPIGDRYTMGPVHAARAVEWLGVSTAVPMHYSTFEAIQQDPHDFEKLVGNAARVVVPQVDGGFVQQGSRFVKML
ncbi:MAG: metal-dependent hydrolase [Candidatus Thermoplasmatota archaeon]